MKRDEAIALAAPRAAIVNNLCRIYFAKVTFKELLQTLLGGLLETVRQGRNALETPKASLPLFLVNFIINGELTCLEME